MIDRPSQSIGARLFGLAWCCLAIAPAAFGASSSAPAACDRQPPSILVLPHVLESEGDVLRLQARVADAGSIASVRAHVLGADDSGWQIHDLAPSADGVWSVDLEPWAGRGARVRYWLDATDALGNGPRDAGSSRTPFLARLTPSAGDPDRAGATTGDGPRPVPASFDLAPWIVALPSLLALLLIVLVRQRRALERRFWFAVLTPVAGLRGAERARALRELCDRPHQHPVNGEMRVRRSDALAWLEQIEPTLIAGVPSVASARAVEPESNLLDVKTLRELEDDMFWLSLLSPLAELEPDDRERAITQLASRTHHHPHHGKRMYDRNRLQRQLRRIRAIDAEAVATRISALQSEPVADAAAPLQAGYTLAELLVTVALIAMTVMISAIYLKPLEAPVRTAGEMVEGVMRQARARAISTTTVHRVRPDTPSHLVVESSANCSSASWTAEPGLGGELPALVTFDSTAWSVCFTTRGIASNNVTFAIDHPRFDSASLEVLLGGAVRWVE